MDKAATKEVLRRLLADRASSSLMRRLEEAVDRAQTQDELCKRLCVAVKTFIDEKLGEELRRELEKLT